MELAVIATRRGCRDVTTLRFPLVPSIQPRLWNSVPRRASSSAASLKVIRKPGLYYRLNAQRLSGRLDSTVAGFRALPSADLVQCLPYQRTGLLEAGWPGVSDLALPPCHRLLCFHMVGASVEPRVRPAGDELWNVFVPARGFLAVACLFCHGTDGGDCRRR